jgi:cell division septum initiation protein DivIVA
MEVELRDETIKYLNKQIEELKAHIKHKDREILKLNQEISLLQKEKEAWKTAPKENVFDSFKNPSQVTPYSYEPTPITSHHHSIEVVQPRPSF